MRGKDSHVLCMFQKIGVALVVVGALVAITGTAVHGEMGHTGREMVAGDVVAFAGALGGVAYVVNGKELRQEVCGGKA